MDRTNQIFCLVLVAVVLAFAVDSEATAPPVNAGFIFNPNFNEGPDASQSNAPNVKKYPEPLVVLSNECLPTKLSANDGREDGAAIAVEDILVGGYDEQEHFVKIYTDFVPGSTTTYDDSIRALCDKSLVCAEGSCDGGGNNHVQRREKLRQECYDLYKLYKASLTNSCQYIVAHQALVKSGMVVGDGEDLERLPCDGDKVKCDIFASQDPLVPPISVPPHVAELLTLPWQQHAYRYNCINDPFSDACNSTGDYSNGNLIDDEDEACYFKQPGQNKKGKACVSCSNRADAKNSPFHTQVITLIYEIREENGCVPQDINSVQYDNSGQVSNYNVECPSCHISRSHSGSKEHDFSDEDGVPRDLPTRLPLSQGCLVDDSSSSISMPIAGGKLSDVVNIGFLSNNSVTDSAQNLGFNMSIPKCIFDDLTLTDTRPDFDEFESNEITDKVMAEVDAIYGEDGSAAERNGEWAGNCGRGLFFYEKLAPRSSNVVMRRKPPESMRLGDNDIWQGRTGCWNPEERFVHIPPSERFLRNPVDAIQQGEPAKAFVEGKVLLNGSSDEKALFSSPIREPAVAWGTSGYLVPDDALLMEDPLCMMLTDKNKFQLNIGNGNLSIDANNILPSLPTTAQDIMDYYAPKTIRDTQIFDEETKSAIEDKGQLPMCLIDDVADDMNDFCRDYLEQAFVAPVNFSGVNNALSDITSFTGTYQRNDYYFDAASYCWVKKPIDRFVAFSPYETWMPPAIKSVLNIQDPLKPSLNYELQENTEFTFTVDGQERKFYNTDFVRPTFTDYAERVVADFSTGDEPYQLFSLEEYGYGNTPISRYDYQFNPFDIYRQRAETINGNKIIPSFTPEEILKPENIGRKEKMKRCISTYVEQWAYQLDRGIVVIDELQNRLYESYGVRPKDASMCQWVAYYDTSENQPERKVFESFMAMFLGKVEQKDSYGNVVAEGKDIFNFLDPTQHASKDPFKSRKMGGKDPLDIAGSAASGALEDIVGNSNFNIPNRGDKLNADGFRRREGLRSEAFDALNFSSAGSLPTQSSFDAEFTDLSSGRVGYKDGKPNKLATASQREETLYQVDVDGDSLKLISALSAASSLLSERDISTHIDFSKRDCKTYTPPSYYKNNLDPFRYCNDDKGQVLINNIGASIATNLPPILVSKMQQAFGIDFNNIGASIMANGKAHWLTTKPDTDILSAVTIVPTLPYFQQGVLWNPADGWFVQDIRRHKLGKTGLFKLVDNMPRDGGQAKFPRPLLGEDPDFAGSILGVPVLDGEKLSRGIIAGRRFVSAMFPANSCMHFVDKPLAFGELGLLSNALTNTAGNASFISQFLDNQGAEVPIPNKVFFNALEYADEGLVSKDAKNIIKGAFGQYDDIRLDHLAYFLYELKLNNERLKGAVGNNANPTLEFYRNYIHGGFKLFEDSKNIYEWTPYQWNIATGLASAFWCEFQTPYFPYFVGKEDYQHNRNPIFSLFNINGEKTFYAGERKLERKYKPNLQYYRVEAIRNSCGPFGVSSTWVKDTNHRLTEWLIGDEPNDGLQEGRCTKWYDLYKRQVNDPKILAWRFPRFEYEWFNAFLSCTGPIKDAPPPVCKLNEEGYNFNLDMGYCELNKAIASTSLYLAGRLFELSTGVTLNPGEWPSPECVGGLTNALADIPDAVSDISSTANDMMGSGDSGVTTDDLNDDGSSSATGPRSCMNRFCYINGQPAPDIAEVPCLKEVGQVTDAVKSAKGVVDNVQSITAGVRSVASVLPKFDPNSSSTTTSFAGQQVPTAGNIHDNVAAIGNAAPALVQQVTTLVSDIKTLVNTYKSFKDQLNAANSAEISSLKDVMNYLVNFDEEQQSGSTTSLYIKIMRIKSYVQAMTGEQKAECEVNVGQTVSNSIAGVVPFIPPALNGNAVADPDSPNPITLNQILANVNDYSPSDIACGAINTALESVVNFVIDNISELIANLVSNITEHVGDLLQALLSEIGQSIKNIFLPGNDDETMKDRFLEIWNDYMDGNVQILQNAWKKAKATVDKVYKRVEDADKEINNLFTELQTAQGKLKLVKRVLNEALANNSGALNPPNVVKVNNMILSVNNIINTIPSAIGNAAIIGANAGELVKTTQEIVAAVNDTGEAIDSIKELAPNVAKALDNADQAVKNGADCADIDQIMGSIDLDAYPKIVDQLSSNLSRGLNYASSGDAVLQSYKKIGDAWYGYDDNDPDQNKKDFYKAAYGFEGSDENAVAIRKFWRRFGNENDQVSGDEPFGFWCNCPEDVGGAKKGDAGKTTRCREDLCTCEQSVLLSGRYMWPALARYYTAFALSSTVSLLEARPEEVIANQNLWGFNALVIAQNYIKPIAICKDYGPFRWWRWCYEQASAKACPVVTREISDSIPSSTVKDPDEVENFTMQPNLFVEKDLNPTGDDNIVNVCTNSNPVGNKPSSKSFIRWKYEEPNHLARLPVWFESATGGYAHEDLIFQSQTRRYDYPFHELAVPFPIDLITRDCGGMTEDGKCVVNSERDKANIGEIMQREGSGFADMYSNPATYDANNNKVTYPNEFKNANLRSSLLRTADVTKIEPVFPDVNNTLQKAEDYDTDKYKELYGKYIKGLYAAATGYAHTLGAEEPYSPDKVAVRQADGTFAADAIGTNVQNIHPRAQDKIVGPRCGDIGGWYEMMLYQARCIKWFGLNCMCDYDKNFASGNAENYVLEKAGATVSVLQPKISVDSVNYTKKPIIIDNKLKNLAGEDLAKVILNTASDERTCCQLIKANTPNQTYEAFLPTELDTTSSPARDEATDNFSNDDSCEGKSSTKAGICVGYSNDINKYSKTITVYPPKLDNRGMPQITDNSGQEVDDATVSILKFDFKIPLADRGYLGPEYATNSDDEVDYNSINAMDVTERNATNFNSWNYLNNNIARKYKHVGLDDVRVGDIIIWDEEIKYLGVGVGYPRHAAYVEEVVYSELTVLKPILDLIDDKSFVIETPVANTGKKISVTVDFKLKPKGKPLYITVSERNWGKHPDTCGNTTRWGRVSTRIIVPPTCSPITYASGQCEYGAVSTGTDLSDFTQVDDLGNNLLGLLGAKGTVDKFSSCQNSDYAICTELYWDQVKIYRPYKFDFLEVPRSFSDALALKNTAKSIYSTLVSPTYSVDKGYMQQCNYKDKNAPNYNPFPSPVGVEHLSEVANCMLNSNYDNTAADAITCKKPDTTIINKLGVDTDQDFTGKLGELKVIIKKSMARDGNNKVTVSDVLSNSDLWKLLVDESDYGSYFRDEIEDYMFNPVNGVYGRCDPPVDLRDNFKKVFENNYDKSGISVKVRPSVSDN